MEATPDLLRRAIVLLAPHMDHEMNVGAVSIPRAADHAAIAAFIEYDDYREHPEMNSAMVIIRDALREWKHVGYITHGNINEFSEYPLSDEF